MATTPWFSTSDSCWLRPQHVLPLLGHGPQVLGDGRLQTTIREELAAAAAEVAPGPGTTKPGEHALLLATHEDLALTHPGMAAAVEPALVGLGPEGYVTTTHAGTDLLTAADARGLLHGFYALLRDGLAVFDGSTRREEPTCPVRMVNQWDNLSADAPMGSVERGYSGDSIFYADGAVVQDRRRVKDYARLLASVGINALSLNNVNVHGPETRLMTDHVQDVADLARTFADHGIATYLSINYAAPIEIGGLGTADPLDPQVRQWWVQASEALFAQVPDLGGYLVKADSENRPGPFTYGRTHADGANMLAEALRPHGGTVFWRCFVYDCRQDWRDRRTDRARAAYDHFMPLDGEFADNVVLQVKNGPMDFQVREPVSPLLGGLERTNVVMELQIAQEYTGQQKHACYLAPQWKQVLDFDTRSADPRAPSGAAVRDVVAGRTFARPVAGVAAVSNIGDDVYWTGHPWAQANLYAYGRLAWDPASDPDDLLHRWSRLTYPDLPDVQRAVVDILAGSWLTYERYTSPLGVGWMVEPGHHYGPSIEGYEYSAWGTYHFADRDGVGVDRTVATGTGYTGQYREPWASVYESVDRCPDELLLFFHHVPYGHELASGRTVIQHIYDTHFQGVEEVQAMVARWEQVADQVDGALAERVSGRLAEQLRSAREWRDQVNTYFRRASGVDDARGRTIY
ncbi:alpha-glucuronidase [Cellulomonas bogoriensis]|uniref:Alpha-glucuronidase n=1 Tax=Cellulomonas bogoriensis 69B4 = DSM 16987 TaxID=1386082 RepID=A0A0A0C4X4_9CELL|nr:alpha-glucuronidase [Cellulomonas bogoriensis]KGM14414.1 alpha-glucuronidase [Cellulomonas bogoriensis 69B4 = DSM 16987]